MIENPPFIPLDFVQHNVLGSIGMVTEISLTQGFYKASVAWIGKTGLHTAWFTPEEITMVDSLPRILLKNLAHPFSNNAELADVCYPQNR